NARASAVTKLDIFNEGGGIIQLDVYHVPAAQLPPNPVLPKQPAQGTAAPHFHGFKILLTNPSGNSTPTYEGPTADTSQPCTGVIFPKPLSGSSSQAKAASG